MKDLNFIVKTYSVIQRHTNLDIFLANNNSEEKVCDFKLKGGWMSSSCAVYAAGDTATIVAQVITIPSIVLMDFWLRTGPHSAYEIIFKGSDGI